jgi:hypothetical protein
MKKIIILSLVLFMIMGGFSLNAQAGKRSPDIKVITPKVEVYYFHFTVRCVTCHAVEDNSKSALTALYPEKVKTGEYAFKGLNLDDAASKPIAKKLGVGGQMLLVVCDDKKIDLTSKVFLYAHDPDKIKAEIKKAVEKVLH